MRAGGRADESRHGEKIPKLDLAKHSLQFFIQHKHSIAHVSDTALLGGARKDRGRRRPSVRLGGARHGLDLLVLLLEVGMLAELLH